MSRATVELDFFGVDKGCSSMSPFPRCLPRQRSFRDIQSAISKINPELLNSVVVSAISHPLSPESTNHFNSNKLIPVPSTTKEAFSLVPRASTENSSGTAPLTIFYNGIVAVYDVPQDKAETIMNLAKKGVSKGCETADEKKLLETINGDLSIARRKSLRRFVEKRSERLTSVSPF
ncbi:hypothetical protein K2173_005810 [Erythroxylum novogranatense]|uniref:Protein TIFY n=1 Tax=Erythroxylum novogranatense TaxID=1862640 RepID=A0AAV8U646_9ROSI|nr:hypothetical protein K2173_005810 [Erythroxylum novogranatense]